MTTITHQSIQDSINKLKDHADESELRALTKLHQQLILAGDASYSRAELEQLIKQDDDALDSFDHDSALFEDVRAIQDSIINFHS